MPSNPFLPYHTSDKAIAVIPIKENTKERRTLQLQHRHKFFRCKMTVNLKPSGGTAATAPAQEGILAMLRNMQINLNGEQSGRHTKSGPQIYVEEFEENRSAPKGFSELDTANQKSYTIYFRHRFYPLGVTPQQADSYGLDLLSEAGNSSALSQAEYEIDFGSIADLFHDAGDMTFVDGSLEVWSEQMVLPRVDANGNAVAYLRANEVVSRTIRKTFTQPGTVEIELPRVSNSRLLGFNVRQTFRKTANDFDQSKAIVIKDDEYVWKKKPIGMVRADQDAVFKDTPNNIVFMKLFDNFDASKALPDQSFSDQLDVSIPVSLDAGGFADSNELEIYVYYAKNAQL